MKVLYYYLKFFCIVGYVNAVCQTNRIEIDGNGYKGITVAVSSKLEPSEIQIQRLKDLFTAASARLYKATKHHVFFKDITIVIPKSWPSDITDSYITGPQIDSAHVIVDKPNRLAKNKPYVSGMTGCGNPGKHIHLEPYTVQFLPADGDADRLFVHHWGHFRWGLFDEHGDTESPVQEPNTNTWFYSSGGTYKPNICVKNTLGKSELNYCGSNMKCSVDENGLPEKDCKFCADETGNTVNGSIMGNIEISSVDEFCGDDGSTVPHNKEAQTPQNRFCQGRSSWEIMRLHSDFKDTTPGSPTQDTTPIFRVVQQKTGQNFVMVLDKSGSMRFYDGPTNETSVLRKQRMTKLKEITSIFILVWLQAGSSLGLVTFNITAQTVAPLTSITTDSVRQELVALIKNIDAAGGTSIGAGLRKGIEVLKTQGTNINGSEIILVTDGENTHSPGIKEVANEILAENVIVTTIAIGRNADKNMETLAKDSGGSSHFYSGYDQSTALIDSFVNIAECASDDENKLYQIESKSLNVTKDRNYTSIISIDDTIGRDTTILLQGPGVNYTSLFLSGPGNRMWTSGVCNDSCRIKIDALAEVGDYVVNVTSSFDIGLVLTLTANSYPRNPAEEVITTTAWSSTDSFDFSPYTPVILFALVKKGSSPVLEASVEMLLEDSEDHMTTINLSDNGFGEDIIQGDGLYTGVILPSQIKSDGRHSLKVSVTGKSGEAKILVPKVKRRKRAAQDNVPPTDLVARTVAGFKRVTSGGSITVQNYSTLDIGDDKISPARITTLKLVSSNGNLYNVSWDAVGDDVTYGSATSYQILLSKAYSDLLNSPERVSALTEQVPTPSKPGNTEFFSLTIPEVGVNYYLAVRAVDESGNKGDVSNILSLSVVTDNSWKRVQTQPPAMSYEGIIASACVAALLVFIIVLCGVCFYKRSNASRRKSGDRDQYGEFSKDILYGPYHEQNQNYIMRMYMYQLRNQQMIRQYYGHNPRIPNHDTYPYHIS
ncbi:calcium-activated chloride channel regulator 1-like [Saccostrea echinata]|uniref:calcium-activated chloride channel regulator 1-like n=1 Tax=Saccostrea echinata TaxID=191078 RepID=UPI002A7EEAEF|nr:calcium-activated chloride channel regulator 1-like [Saccostrea echinata]